MLMLVQKALSAHRELEQPLAAQKRHKIMPDLEHLLLPNTCSCCTRLHLPASL